MTWTILITQTRGDLGLAEAVRRRLLDEWTTPTRPRVLLGGRIDIAPADLSSVDAVIVMTHPADRTTDILDVRSRLEQSGVACVLLLDSEDHAYTTALARGALVERRDVGGGPLAATMLGVLSRQEACHALRAEVAAAAHFRGGLEGQISRMEDELELAAGVQRALLPRSLDARHGFDFGAFWRPKQYVSGDLYDVIPLGPDFVGLFIADAMGHGVPAALMTMILSRSLTSRIGTPDQPASPREVMLGLNEDLIRRRGKTVRFATAAYALLDCRTGRCTYAGAGHPPSLLIGAGGATREVASTGALLGVFSGPDATYEDVTIDLAPHDRLVLYTDGLEYAFPPPGATEASPCADYRIRLAQLLAAVPSKSHAAELMLAVARQTHEVAERADDMTVVCACARSLDRTARRPSAKKQPARKLLAS